MGDPLPKDPKSWIKAAGIVGGIALPALFADNIADFVYEKLPVFKYKTYVMGGSFLGAGAVLIAASFKAADIAGIPLMILGSFLAMVGVKFFDRKDRPKLQKVNVDTSYMAGYNYNGTSGNYVKTIGNLDVKNTSVYTIKEV